MRAHSAVVVLAGWAWIDGAGFELRWLSVGLLLVLMAFVVGCRHVTQSG